MLLKKKSCLLLLQVQKDPEWYCAIQIFIRKCRPDWKGDIGLDSIIIYEWKEMSAWKG